MDPLVLDPKIDNKRITDFLIELSLDPSRLNQFDRDPEAVLDLEGFSSQEKELLLSRDLARIYQVLDGGKDIHAAAATVVIAVVTVNVRCGF
jgi:hypothetical protein